MNMKIANGVDCDVEFLSGELGFLSEFILMAVKGNVNRSQGKPFVGMSVD